ncbi:glycosyltransferase family 4 protein [Pseudomonas luteola]|uniref:glycosyltransferase family 4 protein n=1 Tax=Pseudomonas luteola TaxID=47886 RepID=UPI00388F5ED9
MESKRLLYVVNDLKFFISHRLAIAKMAKDKGYEVHVAAMPNPAQAVLKEHGFIFYALPLNRSGRNPFLELWCLISIWWLFWKVRPSIVHLVTIKPVLYGSIASRFSPVKGVVAAISGLGYVFLAKGYKAGLVRFLVSLLYKVALGRKRLIVIFQNESDRNVFFEKNIINYKRTVLIKGSGVDLNVFSPKPEPKGEKTVVFAARLLKDKGVVEFFDAISILESRSVKANYLIAGDIDPGNPTSLTKMELGRLCQGKPVSVIGYRSDMPEVFENCHLVVLPSYREGLPKVLAEAAASGRAVVTTDVPGCRDAIEPGISGLLVKVKDAQDLANAIAKVITNETLRVSMGHAGRRLAEQEFAIEKIVSQHLDVYEELAQS